MSDTLKSIIVFAIVIFILYSLISGIAESRKQKELLKHWGCDENNTIRFGGGAVVCVKPESREIVLLEWSMWCRRYMGATTDGSRIYSEPILAHPNLRLSFDNIKTFYVADHHFGGKNTEHSCIIVTLTRSAKFDAEHNFSLEASVLIRKENVDRFISLIRKHLGDVVKIDNKKEYSRTYCWDE